MKKRIFTLLLALVLVFGMIPVTARAASLSSGLQYETYEGEVYITGYVGSNTDLVIPSKIGGLPVVAILDFAFSECYVLESIVLPDSVWYIGEEAFSGCFYLEEVHLGRNLEFIGDYAFLSCASLTDIEIPYGVTYVGTQAFGYCASLTDIKIPDSVTFMGNYVFADCDNLTSVDLSENVTWISTQAFYNCYSLTDIDIPEGVTFIEEEAFAFCYNLTDIDLPDSLEYIGPYAFYCCDGLTSITLPENVCDICSEAFAYCNDLKSINFLGDAPWISYDAFNNVDTVVYYPAGNRTWTEDVMQDYLGDLTWVPYTKVKITRQPSSVAVPKGKTATVSVSASGDGLTYQWYFKNAGDNKFYPTSAFKGNTYSITMDASRSGRQVYCVISDRYGNSVKTNTVTLSVDNTLRITRQPVSVVVSEGKNAKVTLEASGDGLTYKWYYKDVGSSKFYLTSSFTGNTYQVAMNSARSGRQLYCVVSDKSGNSIKTNTVTIWMGNPATITKQPTDAAVVAGKAAKVTVGATGDGLTYQWYFKNAGDNKFYPTSAFTGNTYSVTMDASRSGRQVYCVITDKYGTSVTTNTVTLKMATPLAITKQPDSVTVADGAMATTTVTAMGDNLSYTWYVMDVGNKTWTKSSITSKTYSVGMTPAKSGRHVYCVITDEYGNKVTTRSVTLNMKSGVTITTQPVSTTVANGQTATVKVAASGSGLTYKWYFKNAGDSNFYLTNSFKGNSYSIAMDASRSGRQVYCVISDANGNTVATQIVALKMK